jgi:predicted nucleotidyltransferase
MRRLRIEWLEFETAIESRTSEARGYLDTETGGVLVIFDETAELLQELLADAPPDAPVENVIAESGAPEWQQQALREAWRVEEHLSPRMLALADADLRESHRDLEDFTATVMDDTVRRQLAQAIGGRGAFRRFRDVIHGTFRERKQWFAFQAQRRREKASAWLADHGIEAEWRLPQPTQAPPQPEPREHLLGGVLKFTRIAAQMAGVNRIALLGSLTREEPDPKDADVLVVVTDEMDLAPLAKAGRQLAGHAQQLNRGADVFLANERGHYIGRTCPWRECGPFIRASCDAIHCGRRLHLHDDFRAVRLEAKLIAAPPINLWPKVHARVPVPADVERLLLAPLRES